ncbi:MAG: protoporphyrinogen oxidase [Candidatus Hydrogenedentes bacterium]|jgi:oxygen-dependent protoporphyrinogen oxidase|nr:protoporphyrinogen oxidase [Candidatus Hydrogenedentota bacterium]
MKNEVEVAVIGAGVSGLCAATLLAESLGDDAVVLIEASDTAGGYARTDVNEGFLCDRGPNGFLDKEPLIFTWINKLGIYDQLVRANEAAEKRFILKNNHLVLMRPPPAFLLSTLLSVKGRARLLCEPFVKQKPNSKVETIWEFAARRIGPEAADTLVSAMVSGVFGGDAKQLSLEHCFPHMAEMERDHGGLVKAMIAKKRGVGGEGSAMGPGGALMSFAGGIGALTDAAAVRVSSRLRLGCRAEKIEHTGSRYRISIAGKSGVTARSVVMALPAPDAGRLVAALDTDMANALGSIPHAPMTVLCTGYREEHVGRNMRGFGFLAPRNQGKRALGCIWSSSVFPRTAPSGWILLRTMYGGYTDPQALKLSNEELLGHLAKEIHPLMKIERAPEFVRTYRHPVGIPQYMLNHGEILQTLEAAEQRHAGLVLAGNAYRGVSLNDCVRSGFRAAERLLEQRV